jgi:RND superfamily putative drug exporter
VFRSVLIPLTAAVMNLLTAAATTGVVVFAFGGPIEPYLPVFLFAGLFGLSMDYEVFLLTRVKEVFDKTGRNDHATMEGLSATASTITSAALIMILVFGAFAFARVLAVQLIGFGLATAVLLDATLVRGVALPAVISLLGERGVRAPRPRARAGWDDPTRPPIATASSDAS